MIHLQFERVTLASWLNVGYRNEGRSRETSQEAPDRRSTKKMLPIEPLAAAQGPNSEVAINVFRRARHGGTHGPERAGRPHGTSRRTSLGLERKETEVRGGSFIRRFSHIHASVLYLSPSLLLSLTFAKPGSAPGPVETVV